MKRIYFVMGAENSGNRMMVQALAHSGCYGDPHKGHFLGPPEFHGLPDRVAFTRSVLHGGEVPDPIAIARDMLAAGYHVTPIHVYRKTEFAVAGHIKNGYASDLPGALAHIHLCAHLIHELGAFLQVPVVTVIYELFVWLPHYRELLFSQLDLPPTPYEVFNANEKYELDHKPYCF